MQQWRKSSAVSFLPSFLLPSVSGQARPNRGQTNNHEIFFVALGLRIRIHLLVPVPSLFQTLRIEIVQNTTTGYDIHQNMIK
jgi:hypothetical protein